MSKRLARGFLPSAVLVGLLLLVALAVRAEENTATGLGNAVCPDAELLGPKLITDICWSCLFPLKIAGAAIGGGAVPSGASDQALCATQAWVEQEYHRSRHAELPTTPLARYLEGPSVARPCPDAAALRAAFRIEVARRQRRSDGTVSLAGLRLEIPARYRANAGEPRRALTPAAPATQPSPPSGMAPRRRALIAEHAATGLPPAFLPLDLPENRWAGFKALRATWLGHLQTTRRRAVLLVDEAQEMSPTVLNALRLLASARFDSQPLLCVVLAGDSRLTDQLRRAERLPLGSRIRTRLATEHASREELRACLQQLCASAGNAALMSEPLQHTLCDHAAGNDRILVTLAAELLAVAAQHERPPLDEALFLEVFTPPATATPRRAATTPR